jgi:Carboxypeptidase regulatory-like domain
MNRMILRFVVLLICAMFLFAVHTQAQATLGSINGTVTDKSGAVVQGATVKVRNTGTNLEQTIETRSDGSFSIVDLQIGNYSVTFSKDGFKTVVFSEILVRGALTTTVNASLVVGQVSATVTVEGTPLMNQTDTTNGYTLGSDLVEDIPLGTGSFTQLAILAPGVNADLLSGQGAGAGMGNQAIWANGQRDTSNSFTFNSVNANNLFNGKSTSYDNTARFILNTGESFSTPGQTQTSTSVYNAIGQGLPTPPVETIEEVHVTTSMYDASQGMTSGAHIELTTKSGTNQFHGQIYEYHGTNAWDAAPFFLKATGVPQFSDDPGLKRNVFGGTLGGPIIKDKLFFFASYQGQRVADALNGAISGTVVPPSLTDARDAASLAAVSNADFGTTLTAADVDPVAQKILSATTASGKFIVPTPNLSPSQQATLGYEAIVQGPSSHFNADQVNGNIDYDFSTKDRLTGKYYFQRNPSFAEFAIASTIGFPQTLKAGSQVFSLENTKTLSPNVTWEQRFGFIREVANASLAPSLTASDVGMTLPSGVPDNLPGFNVKNADDSGHELFIGSSSNFSDAGVAQTQFEGATSLNWVKGRHTFSFGFNFDYTQLNIINHENDTANSTFSSFPNFLRGRFSGSSSAIIVDGETNRYFRANQAGSFAQDSFKLKSNVTVTLGVRWDWDGPLWEKYGRLTNFDPSAYSYDLATDTITNTGLVVAGNNKLFPTKGESNSTLNGRQWGFAPRIGIAWAPGFLKNVTVRAGYGMYYDRGEFFTEFSPSAGLGISGPFGVTAEQPFSLPINNSCTGAGCLSAPFGTAPLPGPPTSLAGVNALVHNQAQLSGCPSCTNFTEGDLAFLFGGYDPNNKLPYSQNWSLDIQWQPINSLLLSLAYIGNHGVHELMPIPFNEPGIATPSHPINGQTLSYGYQPLFGGGCDSFNDITPTCSPLASEQIQTTIGAFPNSDGNTALRVPFIGYNPNSDFWEAEGISHYNALQFQATKRMSHGLQVNGSYTWSHALDEQSGLGLFFNGNDPLTPRSSYASSDFDRTHVITISYLYQFPTLKDPGTIMKYLVNGWGIGGVTILESGQPFSVYDFSGSVASLQYSADDFITNPILPLAPGITPKQAQTQGTTGVNAGKPYFNPADFVVPTVAPTDGSNGVPPCGPTVAGTGPFCDTVETTFGNNGRNLFRAPFQNRFDFSVVKTFAINERFNLKFQVDAFNIFNHPSFDAPNNNVTLNPCFNPQPCYSPAASNIGFIEDTLGSARFIQMALHLTF